ncbi:hypothetical protein ACQCX5_05170 [Propionibacteriaceae bacterium G57]|uniref:hypothetical protein n=1 Tax=Aestuariimicrobium sp. G57 TaxID=3418485 RepID=UPI003DA765B8
MLAGIILPVLTVATTLVAGSGAASAVPATQTQKPSISGLPVAPPEPAPLPGIPAPCVSAFAWPEDASPTHTRNLMQKHFGLKLKGDWWTDPEYRPMVKIVWQTLDAVNCTDYLPQVRAKAKHNLTIYAAATRSWAWGDWGLTRPGALTFDFAKWQQALDEDDPGRLARLVIHELGHVYNVDRGDSPQYWTNFTRVYQRIGRFSDYGTNDMETYADVLGYYVARCAKDNPFDQPGFQAYYDWARTNVFNGVEFGPAPGTKVDCSESYKAMSTPATTVAKPGAATWTPGPGIARKP